LNLTGEEESRSFDGFKLVVAVEEPEFNTGNRRVLLLHLLSTILVCSSSVMFAQFTQLSIQSLNTKGFI